MSREISADDALCQVQQAQALLSLWLNTTTNKDGDLPALIGAVMTLLEGVPEAMETVFGEVTALEIKVMKGMP